MSNIKPIKINGLWDEGYAIDYHTISSTPIGTDSQGKTIFDTKRTDLGELVYQYKYQENQECLSHIIQTIEPFVINWLSSKRITYVLPVPPTIKDRKYQPVFGIAESIADILNARYSENILKKSSTEQSKNLSFSDKEKVGGSIIKTRVASREQKILLVDDLYESGASLNECVSVLRQDEKNHKIYALTITKTKG